MCPFQYFGISDIYALDDKKLNAKRLEERDLNRLTSDERMKHIIEQAESILTEGLEIVLDLGTLIFKDKPNLLISS